MAGWGARGKGNRSRTFAAERSVGGVVGFSERLQERAAKPNAVQQMKECVSMGVFLLQRFTTSGSLA